METILPKIYGPKNNIKSKATDGEMCQLLAKNISDLKTTKNLVLYRLFVICENPIFGASSDAIDSQKLSVHGHTETNQ